MACAATRPTFSFHHLSPSKLKPHFTTSHFLSLQRSSKKQLNLTTTSIDISKEDKPTSEQQPNSVDISKEDNPTSENQLQDLQEDVQSIDKRRLEEKFAVLNTGIYECRSCGHKFDEAAGDPSYPIPPGLPFDKLPDDWRCPTCGAAKSFFVSKSVEIAGFAQNQQFGLGGNSLTGGQKTLLIYGTLLFFFVLFLSGYFLQ